MAFDRLVAYDVKDTAPRHWRKAKLPDYAGQLNLPKACSGTADEFTSEDVKWNCCAAGSQAATGPREPGQCSRTHPRTSTRS